MIFKTFYLENKELKQEIEFYARENWRKEDRLRDANKKLKEKDKTIEDLSKKIKELTEELKKGKGKRKQNENTSIKL